jgi:hypothetical protein
LLLALRPGIDVLAEPVLTKRPEHTGDAARMLFERLQKSACDLRLCGVPLRRIRLRSIAAELTGNLPDLIQ